MKYFFSRGDEANGTKFDSDNTSLYRIVEDAARHEFFHGKRFTGQKRIALFVSPFPGGETGPWTVSVHHDRGNKPVFNLVMYQKTDEELSLEIECLMADDKISEADKKILRRNIERSTPL